MGDLQKPEDREPSDQERALVEKVKKEIEKAIDRFKDRFKRYEEYRSYYAGRDTRSGSTTTVRTNLIFSTIATIYPQIYAKNPDISFSPAESVSEDRYTAVKQYGKTCETVVSRMLVRGAKLKKKIKAQVRAAMLSEIGWVKLTYQKDIREDPLIHDRLNDIQDNIERLKALTDELDEEYQSRDLTIAELTQQMQALEGDREKVISSGLVVDKIMTEDLLVLDQTVRDFDDYIQSSRMAQRVWMSEEAFETKFKRCPMKSAKKWSGKDIPSAAKSDVSTSSEMEATFVAVWEIWDKEANQVLTWCQGEEQWCREPFSPTVIGRRWYPFFGLCFNPVDGQLYGLSDVELLIKLQEEYNETREKFAAHRKYSIPITVVRSGGSLSDQDVANIKKAQPGDTVVIGGDSSVPLTNDINSLQGPPIDPALYDVQSIRADIEMVSGASDAARGMVLTAKTATEAEIMQQGLVSRTAERQDTIEDMVEEMATYAIEILTGELEIPEVVRFAGEQAVWPQDKNVDAIFDELNLEIRAGSTGKPNKSQEREQWVQLLPQIQQAMDKIMALRQAGQNDMADAMVELAKESLRRFDERIDLDAFFPRKKEGEPDPAMAQQQMQQQQAQLQQAQQIIQQLQGELQKAQQAAQGKEAEFNFKASEADKDRKLQREIEDMRLNAKSTEQGVAQALQANQEIVARLQQVETFLQSMPAPENEAEEDAAEREQLLKEVRAMIAQGSQQAGVAPINITVPVTIDGKGQVVKQGRAIRNPDGSYSMSVVETPQGDEA